MLVIRVDRFKDVESHGIISIRRVEINHIINPVRRYPVEETFYRFSVRVNKTHTVAVVDVLYGHILHHACLSHAGLSNDIHMAPPIVLFDAKCRFPIAKASGSKNANFFVLVHSNYVDIGRLIGASPFVISVLVTCGVLTVTSGK